MTARCSFNSTTNARSQTAPTISNWSQTKCYKPLVIAGDEVLSGRRARLIDMASLRTDIAFVLSDDSPGTMIVNRRALPRVPDKRNDRERMIRRAIKEILRIRLRRDC